MQLLRSRITGQPAALNAVAANLAMTKAELAAIPEDMDMEAAGLGDIGARFATEVKVTCSAL